MSKLTISLVALVAVLAVTLLATYGPSVFAHNAAASIQVDATDGAGNTIKISAKGTDLTDMTGTVRCHHVASKAKDSMEFTFTSMGVNAGIASFNDGGTIVVVSININPGSTHDLVVAWTGNTCAVGPITTADEGSKVKITVDKD